MLRIMIIFSWSSFHLTVQIKLSNSICVSSDFTPVRCAIQNNSGRIRITSNGDFTFSWFGSTTLLRFLIGSLDYPCSGFYKLLYNHLLRTVFNWLSTGPKPNQLLRLPSQSQTTVKTKPEPKWLSNYLRHSIKTILIITESFKCLYV